MSIHLHWPIPPKIGQSQFQVFIPCLKFVYLSKCILQTQEAIETFYHFQKRDHGEDLPSIPHEVLTS